MTPALGQISIYRPTYYMRSGSIVRTRYINTEDASGDFPVTDSCERSATVMGDDYVKLSFKLLGRVVFSAFAYIWYDNQLFFLKETYRPTAKGAYYQYDMKFVSIANMLGKSLCFRYLSIPGQTVSPEPEINMNGTLDDMAAIVIDSIHGAASRLNNSQSQLFYVYVLNRLTIAEDTQQGTTLETFSFSGQYITDVLSQIASKYEIEWWVSQESITEVQLHLCKCERGDTIVLSDQYKETSDPLHKYVSRGLQQPCEYSQEWSDVPQKIIPFGSDRNITRKQALQSINGNEMYVSYGKQLRLAPGHTYTVKDREGNKVLMRTDALGAFTNSSVNSGIETTKQFDSIYPRCHFRVLGVRSEGTEHPIYTMTAAAIKADGVSLMSYDEMVSAGLLPLQIEPNETLSVVFESGYLNGREFEVAYDLKEIDGVMQWTLKIVPEEGGDDGVSLPFGNFVPRAKSNEYEGDMFAIFHMIMPQYYIERAQDELAQAAYDELLAIEDTRPEVKCKTEPEFFANQRLCLGQRVAVHSELFGQIQLKPNGDIRDDSPSLFASRVTSFSHSLTKPNSVEFKLASARVEGRLADIEAAIADRTSDIRGLEQRSVNLSRRGWHDAAELLAMLHGLETKMMLVGVEKYQFQFTMAVQCVNGYMVSNIDHFNHLHVSAGVIQHTQEPYIKYANGGKWEVNETDLTADENGNALADNTNTHYYLYAKCPDNSDTATVVLTPDEHEEDEEYLLIGVLSGEFEDGSTSYRAFNRTNGYTQIAGGTVTSEELRDPTGSLIIDMHSNPPRIVAKRGAQIIGNITFISSDGSEKPLGSTIDTMNEEINKEIGGENLYSGVDPLAVGDSYVHTGIILEKGKKYVITAQRVTGRGRQIDARTPTNVVLGKLVSGGTAGVEQTYENVKLVVTGTGEELILWTFTTLSAYIYTVYGLMVQQGEKPTTYHAGYLAKALERDATKEVTSIDGGLLLSALIKLAQGGVVRAGMSGLADYGQKTIDGQTYQSEGVGFWAGSDYVDALMAACGIESDTLPPVFLSKTGYKSRIGCFRVVDKDTIAVVTGESTIYITNKNIDDVTVMQDSDSEYMDATIRVDDGDPSQSGSGSIVSSITFKVAKSGKYAIHVPQTEIDAVSRVLSYPANPGVYPGQADSGYASAVAYGSFYIRIKNNGAIIHSSSSKTVNTENQTDDGASKWWKDTDSATIPSINITKEIAAGSLIVEIVGSYSVSASADEDTIVHASGDARGEISFFIGDVVITGVEKYCVFAKDGMAIISNSNAAFYVRNSGTQLNVVAKGLPNRTQALPGGLYVSNENLCVKPL